MAYTTPPTFAAAAALTAAQLNTYLSDNMDAIVAPDRAHAYRSSNQSITASTWTVVSTGSESYDTSSMHSNSTNPERVAAAVGGPHLIVATLTWTADTSGTRRLMVRKNDGGSSSGGNDLGTVTMDAPPSGVACHQLVRQVEMSAGDYVSMWAWHDSTTDPLTLSGGQDNCYLQLVRLGID